MNLKRLSSNSVIRVASGPILPERLSYQCVAQINATHTFYAGGFFRKNSESSEDVNRTWIYDWQEDLWIKQNDMIFPASVRQCHAFGNGHIMVLLPLMNRMNTNVREFEENGCAFQAVCFVCCPSQRT